VLDCATDYVNTLSTTVYVIHLIRKLFSETQKSGIETVVLAEVARKVHGRCTEGYGRLRKATEGYGRFRKVIVAGRHRFLFCRRTPNPIPARKTVGSGGLVIAAFTHLRCERGSA
jgi:hypothetical protein